PLFLERQEARGRTESFAVVVQRQILHVQADGAGRRLLVHNDRDGAALDAFAETDSASACQARVRESLQHGAIISSLALDWKSQWRWARYDAISGPASRAGGLLGAPGASSRGEPLFRARTGLWWRFPSVSSQCCRRAR